MPVPDRPRRIRAARNSSRCPRAPARGLPAAASPGNKRTRMMDTGAHTVARAAAGGRMPAHAGIGASAGIEAPAGLGASAGLGARAGIGLRAQHHLRVLSEAPAVAWFEAHTENYFPDGGAHVEALARIPANYPLSLHGGGLS